MRTGLPVLLLALTAVTAACTVATVETPDPATIPSEPPQAHGEEAIGPIVELHSDRVAGIGWRFLVYESASGWCTQFETVDLAATGCGDPRPEEGAVFGGVGNLGGDTATLRPITGFVTEEVATVWLVDESTGDRVPALLKPLDEVGMEGQAFIGFTPEGATTTHLQAVVMNGEIVDTYELP